MFDATAVIAVNAVSAIGLGFFVKMWINGVNTQLKDLREELRDKVEDKLCCERRKFITDELRLNRTEFVKDTDEIFQRLRNVENKQ